MCPWFQVADEIISEFATPDINPVPLNEVCFKAKTSLDINIVVSKFSYMSYKVIPCRNTLILLLLLTV